MNESEGFACVVRREFFPIQPLSSEQVREMQRHYSLLVRWNKVLNLTTVVRLEEAVVRHYCESLFLGVHLPFQPVSILDVGSGAGFPGFPVAILRPDCAVTLAESHQRKAVFLREATRHMRNVTVAGRRAEDIGGQFDWVVSRAVRWQDVLPVADGRVALLVADTDAQSASQAPDFDWKAPIPLPWGEHRVLLIGERTPCEATTRD